MINVKGKQKIKDNVQQSFIERNRNTIAEKISELIKAGFPEDEAHHIVIQVVKNLSNVLLPLKIIAQEQEDEDINNENIKRFARFIVS